jgi:DNA-binding IclR family transcriptional regulator
MTLWSLEGRVGAGAELACRSGFLSTSEPVKAIAAWIGPEEIDEFFDQGNDLVGADGSPLDHDQFRDDLKRIRDRGFSQAYGERVPRLASVAAPVMDSDGT